MWFVLTFFIPVGTLVDIVHATVVNVTEIAVMYKDDRDRQRLIAQIKDWNSNRLDLFALSQPNEVLLIFEQYEKKI